jgi:hypothetical protein
VESNKAHDLFHANPSVHEVVLKVSHLLRGVYGWLIGWLVGVGWLVVDMSYPHRFLHGPGERQGFRLQEGWH